MLHPSTKRLIDKLNDMTRKQRVTWTEGENGAVIHDTEGYRVVLTAEPHSVLLTDTLGREIETCGPDEFADETDALGRPYGKFVGELYREASRHARGTEKAIRALLAGLDAVEETAAEAAPAPAPVLQTLGVPDATTDETAPIESETEITAAVATLADQINGTQHAETPAAAEEPPPPAPEPEPAPEPAPVLLAQPEPEPVLVPEPAPPAPEPVVEPVMAEAAPAAEPVIQTQIEAPAPSVEVPPLAEEPGSFGTFAEFTPAASVSEPGPPPAPEPVLEVQPEPVPAPVPQPEPEVIEAATPEPEAPPAAPPVLPAPTLAQPISLSSIPFGFGLGAAQRSGTPVHPSTSPPSAPEPASEPAKRIIIDGTLDLPDFTPESLEASPQDPYPPPAPSAGPKDLPGEPVPPPEPGHPRRFNPWN